MKPGDTILLNEQDKLFVLQIFFDQLMWISWQNNHVMNILLHTHSHTQESILTCELHGGLALYSKFDKNTTIIPQKLQINTHIYTPYAYLQRTDGRTHRRTDNIYSIFRDKLLLLGEHVLLTKTYFLHFNGTFQ